MNIINLLSKTQKTLQRYTFYLNKSIELVSEIVRNHNNYYNRCLLKLRY
jgi:hypothetical protein